MNRLGERLIRRIVADGPMTVADFMLACWHDPQDGYYATRPAIGAGGDFITAPLVSQMFGELIGLWAAEAWRSMGEPRPFVLAEFGPGDATMMSDMLSAARLVPGFAEAADLWLVETSAPLRAVQARVLAQYRPRWARDLAALPSGQPLVAVANEFLDCLPIEQWVSTATGWRRRRVGARAGALAFAAGEEARGANPWRPDGAIAETSPAAGVFGEALGRRLARQGGAALMLDYGRHTWDLGDTLQAVRRHQRESPLANPGKADLTAHVDFPAFAAAARRGGACVAPLECQADLLQRLGIGERAEHLRRCHADRAEMIDRQIRRLTDRRPGGMGLNNLAARLHAPGVRPP